MLICPRVSVWFIKICILCIDLTGKFFNVSIKTIIYFFLLLKKNRLNSLSFFSSSLINREHKRKIFLFWKVQCNLNSLLYKWALSGMVSNKSCVCPLLAIGGPRKAFPIQGRSVARKEEEKIVHPNRLNHCFHWKIGT